jgi:CRISPR-associated protein Cas2
MPDMTTPLGEAAVVVLSSRSITCTLRRVSRRKSDDPFQPFEKAAATDRHRQPLPFSEYRSMWMLAMFDLPVITKEARKRYARFRAALLKRGFTMLQFSVYARQCSSEEFAEGVRADVRAVLPPDGQVRLLGVTDRQFGKMEVFFGRKRKPTEDPPAQFMLF